MTSVLNESYSQENLITENSEIKILERVLVDSVVADFPVGFSTVAYGDFQFIAYYNKERSLTVASRKTTDNYWKYHVLPTKVGWDSHNSITMTLDRELCLHVSGNMHNDSMTYFITEKTLDISTFRKIFPLVKVEDELSCTYPGFIKTPNGQVIYKYRIGGSGNGVTITNAYDEKTKSFNRLTDKPLFDGLGEMSAYASGPRLGPDGKYHVAWLWRNTPRCETNHNLSYARSSDLINWENMQENKYELPITPRTKLFTVDPVPPGGGAINGAFRLFFSAANAPHVAYMKYDENGNNQFFIAKSENRKWMIKQVSNWDHRWEFSGPGSITFEIRMKNVEVTKDNQIIIDYWHKKYGDGILIIDAKTLKKIEDRPIDLVQQSRYPEALLHPSSDRVENNVHWMNIPNQAKNNREYYSFRWETLGKSRFYTPPTKPIKPSALILYKFLSN
jgi:hypothetical protein